MPIRRRKKTKLLIPLASMGDIAFLLIIFFMLVADFMRDNQQLDPAAGADVAELPAGEVSVVLDQNGILWLQGLEVSVHDLGPAVEILIERRREDGVVHLNIHRDLPRGEFMPVIEALSGVGARLALVGQTLTD